MSIAGYFEKVSYIQFKKDWIDTYQDKNFNPDIPEETIKNIYKNIKLPVRATYGSAGYDFISPLSLKLQQNQTIKIPTGIRAIINRGWALLIVPRSGLGFKYRIQLDNTIGVIDSDYSSSDNEGHIFIKITNDTKSDKVLNVAQGDKIVQGIFVPYGITEDDYDQRKQIRNGGFGSTGII